MKANILFNISGYFDFDFELVSKDNHGDHQSPQGRKLLSSNKGGVALILMN